MFREIKEMGTMKDSKVRRSLLYLPALAVICLLTFSACSTTHTSGSSSATTEPGLDTVTKTPLTTEYDDIPVPAELKRDQDRSFVYETPGIKTAIIYYDSFPQPLDHSSLVLYFKTNMVAQGWKLVDIYSYDEESNLNFEKGNRRCHITIFDKFLQTKVVIKVGQILPATQGKGTTP